MLARVDSRESFAVGTALVPRQEGEASWGRLERGEGCKDSSALGYHQQSHRWRPHACSKCGQAFADGAALSRHRMTHMEEDLYKCPQCEQSFEGLLALTRHQGEHVCEKCVECGQAFEDCEGLLLCQKSLGDEVHGRLESREPPRADSDLVTQLSDPLEEPADTGFTTAQKKFSGDQPSNEKVVSSPHERLDPIDKQPFTDHLRPTLHQRIHLKAQTLDGVTPENIPEEEEVSSGGLGLQDSSALASQTPPEEEPGLGTLGDSLLKDSVVAAPLQKRSSPADRPPPVSTEMAALIRRSSTKPYKCHDCEQSFEDAGGLSCHQAGHTKGRLLKCPECGKGFPERLALIRHQMEHTVQKARAVRQPPPPLRNNRGKERDPGSPLEFGESFTEISAVLLQRENHISERGASLRLKDRGGDGKQSLGDPLQTTEPYFHLDLGKTSGAGGVLGQRHGQQEKGRYFGHSEPGKISRNSSILLQHLQNHTAEQP